MERNQPASRSATASVRILKSGEGVTGFQRDVDRGCHGKGVFVMDGRNRADIKPGTEVVIVLKKDQRTGKLTRGVVKDILTKSAFHPHGIKVRLVEGQVGRVKGVPK